VVVVDGLAVGDRMERAHGGAAVMRPDVRYARHGDVALAYQVVGDGPRDLLLVGLFVEPRVRLDVSVVCPFFVAVGRLLAADPDGSAGVGTLRPGLGSSADRDDARGRRSGARRGRIAEDDWVGLWDGCLTSVLYAATHPDRVASLVLFGSSPAQMAAADYP